MGFFEYGQQSKLRCAIAWEFILIIFYDLVYPEVLLYDFVRDV